MSVRMGSAWLIIGCIVFLPGTFIITYAVAVVLQHARPNFPYISETGTYPPESCVFGQLLNIGAVFVGLTMYVRYRQVDDHLSSSQKRLKRTNKAALILGLIAAFGVSIVANFQMTNVLTVHIMGAILAFGVGLVYVWMHAIMSLWTQHTVPPLNGRLACVVRIVCCAVSTVSFFLTVTFGALSYNFDDMHLPGKQVTFLNVSTSTEWIMALVLLVFFMTYIGEFRWIQIEGPIPLKTLQPMLVPTMERVSLEGPVS